MSFTHLRSICIKTVEIQGEASFKAAHHHQVAWNSSRASKWNAPYPVKQFVYLLSKSNILMIVTILTIIYEMTVTLEWYVSSLLII